MNKFKLFPLALAAFAFSACTSEDAVENNPNVEGVKSYVAVNINNVGAGGTRADAEYENGTAAESKINTIRFYFFTSEGKPYKMTDGTNFKEIVNPAGTDQANGGNVEHITNATIVIKGENMTYPESMMAVINPETLEDGVLTKFMHRDDVKAALAKQNFNGQRGTAADFVMTSSVYADEDNKMVWTSDISGHVAKSESAALNNPVDIYVERVAAKITSTAQYDNTNKFYVGETATGTPVYAMIEGWGIASENTSANLIKKISTTWTALDLGFNWNDFNNRRSFWETTPESALGAYKSYDEYTKTKIGDVYYTLPNTNSAETTRPIYVAAAKLVDVDGNTLEIAKYKGVQYLSETDVKNAILKENIKYYKDAVNADGVAGHDLISAADLKFVVNPEHPSQVKAQLVDGVQVYKKAGDSYVDATAEANGKFGAEYAVIHKEGMTYYWTSVTHLGGADKTGHFGMVRNHFYKVDVTKITGFGTAVYDKENEFKPEPPIKDEETYLAARINVLSWRVVNQSVELK